MKAPDADVAVIGLGALGASALWRLAARGVRVLGFEQFRPGHALGSSHGHTRLFRLACPEHPGLVALAQRSLALWRELAAQAGAPLVDLSGGLVIGPPDGELVTATLAAARAHGLPIGALTAAQLDEAFPQHAGVPGDHVALWDPSAGIMRAQDAVIAAT
ncbi:MAG: sarcosine oxidase, partial [Solirubrobacteraceae bacterium]|nr:sarcosine oxidase [Solirubrobacteraceae bacterium]